MEQNGFGCLSEEAFVFLCIRFLCGREDFVGIILDDRLKKQLFHEMLNRCSFSFLSFLIFSFKKNP